MAEFALVECLFGAITIQLSGMNHRSCTDRHRVEACALHIANGGGLLPNPQPSTLCRSKIEEAYKYQHRSTCPNCHPGVDRGVKIPEHQLGRQAGQHVCVGERGARDEVLDRIRSIVVYTGTKQSSAASSRKQTD